MGIDRHGEAMTVYTHVSFYSNPFGDEMGKRTASISAQKAAATIAGMNMGPEIRYSR